MLDRQPGDSEVRRGTGSGGRRRIEPAAIGLWMAIAVAAVLRLPQVSTRALVGYDDGVYLASVLAMRRGGAPFSDVYSSQGPAFLPLLRAADIIGLGVPWAARMVPVLAGIALVPIAYRLALRVGDHVGAVVASMLVATSGALLFSTTRIESDGVVAALGAGAVLAATSPRRRRLVVAVVLIGLAIAVKSLMAGPALLAVLWLVGRRGGFRAAAGALLGAVAVLVMLSVPWGISDVWDQSVGLHLVASERPDLSDRLSYLRETLWQTDRLLVAVGVIGLAIALVRLRRRPHGELGGQRDVVLALWIWMAASVLILVFHAPLWAQHFTVVVTPAAVLAARYRPPAVVLAAVVAVLLAGHAAGARWRLSQPHATTAERNMVALLASIEPLDSRVITDEPTLGWLADRASPGQLVDTSYVRIQAGDLTTAKVAAAAHEPGVCAVLFWSGRFDTLPGLRASLPDYQTTFIDGDHELLLRQGCRLPRSLVQDRRG